MWRVKRNGSAFLISVVSFHSGPVTAIALLHLHQDSTLALATTSNDSLLCLTKTSLKEGNLVQEVKEPHWQQDMKGGVALALHLTRWSTF